MNQHHPSFAATTKTFGDGRMQQVHADDSTRPLNEPALAEARIQHLRHLDDRLRWLSAWTIHNANQTICAKVATA